MIKVHILRGGMWRCVYRADVWTLAAHALALAAAATVGIGLWRS